MFVDAFSCPFENRIDKRKQASDRDVVQKVPRTKDTATVGTTSGLPRTSRRSRRRQRQVPTGQPSVNARKKPKGVQQQQQKTRRATRRDPGPEARWATRRFGSELLHLECQGPTVQQVKKAVQDLRSKKEQQKAAYMTERLLQRSRDQATLRDWRQSAHRQNSRASGSQSLPPLLPPFGQGTNVRTTSISWNSSLEKCQTETKI